MNLGKLHALGVAALTIGTSSSSDPIGIDAGLGNLSPPTRISSTGGAAIRSIHRPISHDVGLRAEIVNTSGEYEVVVLGGDGLTRKNVGKLLDGDFHSIINGTFFRPGRSMGDIVGVSMNDPNKSISRPFRSADKALEEKVFHRFFVGERLDGSGWVKGRRSELRDEQGHAIPKGAELSKYFRSCIGGLAQIDIENPKLLDAIADGHKGVASFVRIFNHDNRNYNGLAAYTGLDGWRPRARSGVILAEDRATHDSLLIYVTIGNGNSSLKGVTIFGFGRECVSLCERIHAKLNGLVMLDGGESVSFASKSEGMMLSSREPLSGIGARRRAIVASNEK